MAGGSEGWGGKREGAGRPKGPQKKARMVTLPLDTWEAIDAYLKRTGQKREDFFQKAALDQMEEKK